MPGTNHHTSPRSPAVGLAVALLSVTIVARAAAASAETRVTTESVHQENLSAANVATHHYDSPVDRAQDALLIVKVKAAIADQGLADDYPLTVDADHGRVTLTGVLASPEDVHRAAALVAGIDGVKGINNRMTWHKAAQ